MFVHFETVSDIGLFVIGLVISEVVGVLFEALIFNWKIKVRYRDNRIVTEWRQY